MFGFFKKAKPCEHEYETIDSFYKEKRTEYRNCFDKIEAYTRRKCKKCGDIKDILLVSESFLPEMYYLERKEKENYIKYLVSIGFKKEIDLYRSDVDGSGLVEIG